MICQKEARADIATNLGIAATRVTKPTWDRAQHLYACTYVYPNGKIAVSVKEMSSATETTAYFNSIVKKYGTTQPLIGLGQGAWVLQQQRRRGAQGLQGSARERARHPGAVPAAHAELRRRHQCRGRDPGLLDRRVVPRRREARSHALP